MVPAGTVRRICVVGSAPLTHDPEPCHEPQSLSSLFLPLRYLQRLVGLSGQQMRVTFTHVPCRSIVAFATHACFCGNQALSLDDRSKEFPHVFWHVRSNQHFALHDYEHDERLHRHSCHQNQRNPFHVRIVHGCVCKKCANSHSREQPAMTWHSSKNYESKDTEMRYKMRYKTKRRTTAKIEKPNGGFPEGERRTD